MAQRGGRGTRSLVPLGGLIALVLALGVVVLVARSGKTPPNNAAPGQPFPSAGAPGASTPGIPGVPSAPGVRPGMPVQPTTAPTSPGPSPGGGGTASPGTSPAAGGEPMPNTGGPFPWWLGLLPISLGLGLMRALHRRPATDGPATEPAGSRMARPVSARPGCSGTARHRERPPSAPGTRRP